MHRTPVRRRCILLTLLLALPLVACEQAEQAPVHQAQALPAQAQIAAEEIAPAPMPGISPLPVGARTDYEQNSVQVFKALAPSVVFVTQKQIRRDRWSRRTAEIKAGSGTGFVWDKGVCEIKCEDIGGAFDTGELQVVFAHALIINNADTDISGVGN